MLDQNNPRVFETAVDSLDVGGYLVDRHRKIVYWNRGEERISGYLRQDVTRRFCRECNRTKTRPFSAARIARWLAACATDRRARRQCIYVIERAIECPCACARCLSAMKKEIFAGRQRFSSNAASFRDPNVGKMSWPNMDAWTKQRNCRIASSWLRTCADKWICSRHGLPFGVLRIQPNRLQLFQSAHGHEAVRSILRVLAHTMKEVLRATDFLGRWEGDQFLAILPMCADNFIEKIGHRLKATVSGSGIHWWGDRLSVPVGVAATSATAGDTVESIVGRLEFSPKQKLAEVAQAAAGGGV